MSDTRPLEGRVALVTGASQGIGAATAIALAKAGAHVVLTARTVKKLEEVEDAIHAAGGTSTIAPVDLTETDGVARLASAMASRKGWMKRGVTSLGLIATAAPASSAQIASIMHRISG